MINTIEEAWSAGFFKWQIFVLKFGSIKQGSRISRVSRIREAPARAKSFPFCHLAPAGVRLSFVEVLLHFSAVDFCTQIGRIFVWKMRSVLCLNELLSDILLDDHFVMWMLSHTTLACAHIMVFRPQLHLPLSYILVFIDAAVKCCVLVVWSISSGHLFPECSLSWE